MAKSKIAFANQPSKNHLGQPTDRRDGRPTKPFVDLVFRYKWTKIYYFFSSRIFVVVFCLISSHQFLRFYLLKNCFFKFMCFSSKSNGWHSAIPSVLTFVCAFGFLVCKYEFKCFIFGKFIIIIIIIIVLV